MSNKAKAPRGATAKADESSPSPSITEPNQLASTVDPGRQSAKSQEVAELASQISSLEATMAGMAEKFEAMSARYDEAQEQLKVIEAGKPAEPVKGHVNPPLHDLNAQAREFDAARRAEREKTGEAIVDAVHKTLGVKPIDRRTARDLKKNLRPPVNTSVSVSA